MDEATRLLDELEAGLSTRARQESLATSVCRLCVELLDADGGYMAVSPSRGDELTVYSTDGRAERMADLEIALGEGPAHESFVGARRTVADLSAAWDRWPLFGPAASAAVGDLHLQVLPLGVGIRRIGVLTTYYESRGPQVDPRAAQALADGAGIALLGRPEPRALGFGRSRLEAGTEVPDGGARPGGRVAVAPRRERDRSGRDPLDLATGMVAVQMGVPAWAALAVMRARAFSTDVELDDLASAVVERRLTFDPGSAGPP
ncbi:GAF domain-containing protein [Paraoerskovia sediminicola]|nr:GAF domain-containing protein [Paraoerskovia sediminicola]